MGFWKFFTEFTVPNSQVAYEAKYDEMNEAQLIDAIRKWGLNRPCDSSDPNFINRKLAMNAVLERKPRFREARRVMDMYR